MDVLGIFFMVLPIIGLIYVFMFDKIYVWWKVRQYNKYVKNKIRTKWKI